MNRYTVTLVVTLDMESPEDAQLFADGLRARIEAALFHQRAVDGVRRAHQVEMRLEVSH